MTTRKAEVPHTVEGYLALPYTLRVTPDPHGGYVGVVEELPGCITQAESWVDVGELLRDALRAWITVALEDGRSIPVPTEHGEAARFLLRLPQTLHRDLQRAAEREGVSLNHYIVYRLAVDEGQRESASGTSAGRAAGHHGLHGTERGSLSPRRS